MTAHLAHGGIDEDALNPTLPVAMNPNATPQLYYVIGRRGDAGPQTYLRSWTSVLPIAGDLAK